MPHHATAVSRPPITNQPFECIGALSSFGRHTAKQKSYRPDNRVFWQVLNQPFVWEVSRAALDVSFGVYKQRFNTMQAWRILDEDPDVLDIGCGIGQYSLVTRGHYLG